MRYRQLLKVYKNYVGVFRSPLHGLGLFCTKEIDPSQMIIEYSGYVIRKVLSDPRERLYDSLVSGGSFTMLVYESLRLRLLWAGVDCRRVHCGKEVGGGVDDRCGTLRKGGER